MNYTIVKYGRDTVLTQAVVKIPTYDSTLKFGNNE